MTHWHLGDEVGGGTVILRVALNDTPLRYLHPEERLAAALLDSSHGPETRPEKTQRSEKRRSFEQPPSSLSPPSIASRELSCGVSSILFWTPKRT